VHDVSEYNTSLPGNCCHETTVEASYTEGGKDGVGKEVSGVRR
jgi:hypothetical protein